MKISKKIFATAISVAILASVTLTGTQASALENNKQISTINSSVRAIDDKVFSSITDAKNQLKNLYISNEDKIISLANNLRPDVNFDVNTYTLQENCGPTSAAVQKVFAENGFYIQTRQDSYPVGKHEYNLFQARMTDGSVENIVVDGTYRQFFSTYYSKVFGISVDSKRYEEILKSDLPCVLVYEYNNIDEATQIIKDALGSDVDESAYNWINEYYETHNYVEPEFQFFDGNNRMLTDVQKQMIYSGLSYDKPFDDSLYVEGSWDNYQQSTQLVYKGNGVYEAYFPTPENKDLTMKITDKNGNSVYCYNDSNTITAINPNFYSSDRYCNDTTQNYLSKAANTDSLIDFALATNGNTTPSLGFTIRIDTRTGADSPLIRVLNYLPKTIGTFGDVNMDSILNQADVAAMQACICEDSTLTTEQKMLSDVNGDNNVDLKDTFALQLYLADEKFYNNIGLTAYNNFYDNVNSTQIK